MTNCSLFSGTFPSGLRRAIITPILKKASLDKNSLGNYRPVSNLPFVGKLIEKVVSAQVSDYISSNGLSDPYQSAYTKARSTETALACVQNDILRAIDNQQAVFLLMLDLSAAFETVSCWNGLLGFLVSRGMFIIGVRPTWRLEHVVSPLMGISLLRVPEKAGPDIWSAP